MARVLITGARGKTGEPLARSLAARDDVQVRAGSSRPDAVAIDGVRPTAFDWDDRSTWTPAVHGVDAVYLVRPDREDAPELLAALLADVPDAARVVLLSEWDAGALGADSWAMRIEDLVSASRHPSTIVRPSWFMQVLSDQRFYRDAVLVDGVLPFAAAGAEVAWIDARDIAAVVEQALLDGTYADRTLEITGPEALSLPRTAEVLAEGLRRPVEHLEVTIDEAVEGLLGFEREELRWTLERVRRGGFAGVTDTVEQVTGRPARPLSDFARQLRGQR